MHRILALSVVALLSACAPENQLSSVGADEDPIAVADAAFDATVISRVSSGDSDPETDKCERQEEHCKDVCEAHEEICERQEDKCKQGDEKCEEREEACEDRAERCEDRCQDREDACHDRPGAPPA
jgi:hypothetical protein